MKLASIVDFGSIDAESDELLAKCFAGHPAINEVLDGRRYLILGRKGSGKTAIYKKVLSLDEPNTFAVGYDLTDYPWHYHDVQVMPSAADQERYLNSWRYLLLLSLSKILLNLDSSQPWSDTAIESLRKIEDFIIDTYGSRDPDITEIFHVARRLKLKSLGIDLKVFKAGAENDIAMNQLPQVFQDVNRNLQKFVLQALNPDNRYYICFDQLDINFQPNSDEYRQRIIGLILAARDFANAAREQGKKLKVLVFLRSDIYYKSLLSKIRIK